MTTKLFVPRKNYLNGVANPKPVDIASRLRSVGIDSELATRLIRAFEGVDFYPRGAFNLTNAARDELTNYLTIERWANSIGGGSTGGRGATVVVAASNSLNPSQADFRCTGAADDLTIQKAVNAVVAGTWGRGRVLLMEGTYNCTGTIDFKSKVSLFGMGMDQETRINLAPFTGSFINNALDVSDLYITASTNSAAAITVITANRVFRVKVVTVDLATSTIVLLTPAGGPWSETADCDFEVGNSTGAVTVVAPGLNSDIHDNLFLVSVGIGVDTSTGTGVQGVQVHDNRFNLCQRAALVNSNQLGGSFPAIFRDNFVTQCGDATHPSVQVNGRFNTVTHNLIFPFAGSSVGINVAGGSTNVVTLNDLRNIGSAWGTAAITDAGAGTVFGYTGAPALPGWNLI